MKKVIKTPRIIVILAVIGFLMVACGGDCEHSSWTGWDEISFGRETRECNDCIEVEARLTKNIGETGEAGGVIFYRNTEGFILQDINPANNKTVYYLEAWTTNETASPWGDYGTLVTDITTFNFTNYDNVNYVSTDPKAFLIGNGRKDTQIIIAHMEGKSITNTAAQRCASATHGTKEDWFLPSLGELNELYKAKGHTGVPTSGWFWSSSQVVSSIAWEQHFGGGVQYGGYKTGSDDVRAVRAF